MIMPEECKLSEVRYKEWDELRGALYNVFAWYMHHQKEILELAHYEGQTPDRFIIGCLDHGMETYQERYENVTRGDRI